MDFTMAKNYALRFADDLVLFAECPNELQHMLQQLADQNAKV